MRLSLTEEEMRALAHKTLTAHAARLYLLHHYGDARAPRYTTYAIAKREKMRLQTLQRLLRDAQEIMEAAIRHALHAAILVREDRPHETTHCFFFCIVKRDEYDPVVDTTAKEAILSADRRKTA